MDPALPVSGGQLSSRLLSARSANALLEIPAAEGIIPKVGATSLQPQLLHPCLQSTGCRTSAHLDSC